MEALLRGLRASVRSRPGVLVLAVVVLSAVFLGISTQQKQTQGFENFVPDNPAAQAADRIGDEFQRAQTVLTQIAIVDTEDGDVLSPDGLAAAADVRQFLTTDERVTSALAPPSPQQPSVLTFADVVLQAAQAQGLDPSTLDDATIDRLYAGALEQLPEDQRAQFSFLLADGDDGRPSAGMVLVFLDSSDRVSTETREDAMLAMGELDGQIAGLEVYPLNFVYLSEQVNSEITSQLGTLLGVAFLLIILILIGIYRTVSDVLASLFGLVFSIIWMQGIGTLLGPGFLGITGGFSEMTMIIPILLVGLGVDYGIHLTMRYREERGLDETPTQAADGAIKFVGAALILATLTTVVGFLTNLTNPLPPLQDWGVFAAVGVASAFVIMTTFVPALRLFLDRRKEKRGTLRKPRLAESGKESLLGRISSAFAPAAVQRPYLVLGIAGLVTLVGGLGATQLSTEFSQTEFFPEDSRALDSIELSQERFGGDLTEQTDILVEGDVATPASLNALREFSLNVADTPDVRSFNGQAQVESPLSMLLVTATGTSGEPPSPDLAAQVDSLGLLQPGPVPSDADVSGLYDTLIQVNPQATSVLSRDGQGGYDAMLLRVGTSAGDQVDEVVTGLEEDVEPLRQAGLEVTLTSDNILIDTVLDQLQASQVNSLIYTLLASMAILALAFWVRDRKPMLGVLAIFAVAIVVAWVFGLMAAVGIPFNVMTAMVSALAIGIGVPFGIHVVNRFLEDRRRYDTTMEAMRMTLMHTGGALVGSGVTTVAGFGVLVFASVPPMRQFGIVTASTIFLALVSSIVVLPAMLALWARYHHGHDEPAEIEAVLIDSGS